MGLPLADAFDSRPLGTLTLGGREYAIPPLTFGRFQRLLGQDMARLVAEIPTFAAEALTGTVAIVAPEIDPDDWKAHATEQTVARLFLMFAKGHDWPLISDAIDFGKEPEAGKKPPSPTELTSALLAFCRANPAYSIEDLLGMRLEGFYLLVAAQREMNERAAAEAKGDTSAPETIPVETADPERAAHLRSMLDDAEARANG